MATTASSLLNALPAHLAERARVLADRPVNGAGSFVLYWTHHALRAEENPALDAAIALANALRLPVLVYQGLAGRHRFNADRHHAFILEGARDLHAALARRGIGFVLHVPDDPSAPGPLPALSSLAAALIVEDFPAPPFPAWTTRLVSRTSAPALAIDAACVIPMLRHGTWYDRAFKFESKTSAEFHARIRRDWPTIEPAVPWDPRRTPQVPGLRAVDPASMDIPALCAACAIDHSIPPVPHTRGGIRAAQRRWRRFRERGLRAYDARRNNAAILDGVSRLSGYLHYGMIAPGRIAREAAAQRSEGAAKFLNELLVWRELAHAFCFYFREDPESTAAIPEWARATLAAHARDQRDVLDWETLARGRTGDPLWDLAQASLLRQGELHNNLRMTWGKAIVGWSRGAAHALERLFDLNHRYALDGNDPNSYGGLLWCLGQFDRPFEPERPVLGTLRPRDTASHAERLDMARYAAIARRPRAARIPSVAIVGGGIAGLAAARTLRDHGVPARVFDKGRGPGGRAPTRFIDAMRLDHGAAYAAASDPRFDRHLHAWRDAGVVLPWTPRILNAPTNPPHPNDPPLAGQSAQPPDRWFVGAGGMHAIAAHLAADAEVSFGVRIERLEPAGGGDDARGPWRLIDADDRDLGSFDLVLLNAPAPQSAAMLAPALPELAECAAGVAFDPCWTLLLVAPRGADPAFDVLLADRAASNGPDTAIEWLCREDSKPGRAMPPGLSAWVAHATVAWSREHLELSADRAATLLLEHTRAALGPALDPRQPPILALAHRWRYARCASPWRDACHFDAQRGIGLCGDWFGSTRGAKGASSALGHGTGGIETAYLSGVALAGRVLATVADDPGDDNDEASGDQTPPLFAPMPRSDR